MLALLFAASLVKAGPVDLTFTIDGIERKAIVFRSSIQDKPEPVVFVFHGFGGGSRQAAFSYRLHEAWPEANVVYPQGLEVSLLGRSAPGWQISPKMQNDRDLKFYDAMLAKMRSDYHADSKHVYSCGMSNGAIFTYVLLSTRANTLAAAAPVAGFAAPAFKGSPPTPILITHGTKDPLIPLQAAIRARDVAIANNGVGSVEKEWAPGYTQYTPVKNGNDVIWHTHDGGHAWPPGTTEAIVRFFKAHPHHD